jgi:signal transduction histidine kinase
MRELEQGVSEFLASNIVHESLEKIIESITSAIKNGLKIDQIMLINRTEMKMYPKLSEKLAYIPKVIQWASVKEAKNEEERTQKKLDYLPELESLGELCIPIYIEHTLAYLLILPEKKSQENYTQREKKVINMMRQKIALSLQILEYNQILRDEVDRQTLQINEQNIKLEASYQKLETLDHEKDVFMNMAAHELRTPMTIIRWYADILLEWSTGSIAPAQKKLIENILRGSQSLLDLVNDLLDLSRIDAGKMELKYESCDVKQFTYDIYENFKALMAKKNMQFKLEESLNTNYELCTDKAKLTLIYNNLLSNAYKYTPEHGDVLFKTSTVVEDNTAWLTFSITDSGVGIPTDELPKLFDRFANISTHNNIAATIQSTGLGLSIVKKIVTGMWGTIKAESIIGKGSTFTVSLPYNPPKKG